MRNLVNQRRPAAIGAALALAMAAYALAPAAAQECTATAPVASKTCTIGPKVVSVNVQAAVWTCGVKIKDIEDLINKFQTGPLDDGTTADAGRVRRAVQDSKVEIQGMEGETATALSPVVLAEKLFVAFNSPSRSVIFLPGETERREIFTDCFTSEDMHVLGTALDEAAAAYLERHGG